MTDQDCDSRPGVKPPPLRTIGDTYTVPPGNPCAEDDQQPACIAGHVEKALYFRNRSLECREEFSRNAKADRPEVTCPTVPAEPAAAQNGLWRDITHPWENIRGWGLFVLICAGAVLFWPSRRHRDRSSGSGPDETILGPGGEGWKRPE